MTNQIILFLVKLGFTKMKASDKVVRAKDVVTKMTANPDYSTPIPTLVSIATAADNLDIALQNLDGSRLNTSIKNEMEEALNDKMRAIAGYVQSASNGNKVKIEGAGLSVKSASTPVGILGPVTDLTIQLGLMPGSVDIKWKPIRRKTLYVIQTTINPFPANWELVQETTKSKITFSDLPSGQTVYYRIACITSAGVGPWSEPISIRVY